MFNGVVEEEGGKGGRERGTKLQLWIKARIPRGRGSEREKKLIRLSQGVNVSSQTFGAVKIRPISPVNVKKRKKEKGIINLAM